MLHDKLGHVTTLGNTGNKRRFYETKKNFPPCNIKKHNCNKNLRSATFIAVYLHIV